MANAFSTTRESDVKEEQMKYIVKGQDFCLVDPCGLIDVLFKPMEMMAKAQPLKEDPYEYVFKNVELLPCWMTVKKTEDINGINKNRRKVIEWVDRTPANCLEEMRPS